MKRYKDEVHELHVGKDTHHYYGRAQRHDEGVTWQVLGGLNEPSKNHEGGGDSTLLFGANSKLH